VKSLKRGIDNLKLPDALFGHKVERVNKLDGIKLITKDFWLMFRASGTEPIVRVYAESKSQVLSDKLIELGKKDDLCSMIFVRPCRQSYLKYFLVFG